MAMAGSLGSNYLLSAGASLFKALAKSLDAETWRCYCGTVLWDALHSPKAVVRKNAVEKWLPSIGHAKAPAFDDLKERLLTADQGGSPLSFLSSTWRPWTAKRSCRNSPAALLKGLNDVFPVFSFANYSQAFSMILRMDRRILFSNQFHRGVLDSNEFC